MKKKISFSTQGTKAYVGNTPINRILPNRYANAVGPFVFLDHIPPAQYLADKPIVKGGTGPHPHRGIATLTYILNGEGEHFDSRGHRAKIYSGGVQWMKAGNGIIHDENFSVDSQTTKMKNDGFQFWINLPSNIKAEEPEYLSIQASEVPKHIWNDKKGWLKVIVGEYENLKSQIPNYSKQFLYHIHLYSGEQFSIETETEIEYATFLPQHNATVNDKEFLSGEFIEFSREKGTIEIKNNSAEANDIILFGGEKYTEPIIAHGPFVMNTQAEIEEAYQEFYAGKYGEIDYKMPLTETGQ